MQELLNIAGVMFEIRNARNTDFLVNIDDISHLSGIRPYIKLGSYIGCFIE